MLQHSHWYYILGYLLVTSSHNWPVMIALAAGAYSAWRLYIAPTRRNVRLLYGWAMLAFAYEYVKHLGAYLSAPVVFLCTADWIWMQPAGIFVVEWLVPVVIILLALMLLWSALGPLGASSFQAPSQ